MRAVPWVLAVLLGVSIAVAALLKSDLDAERARSAALDARLQSLERAGSVRAPVMSPAPGRVATTPPTTLLSLPPASPPRPQRPAAEVGGLGVPPGPNVTDFRAVRERQRALWRDPEYRAAMLEQHKTALRRRYGDAAQEFGLTASEMDRLLEVLAVAQLPDAEMAELGAGVRGDGTPDPAQMRKLQELMATRQRTQEAALRTLLGDARYAQWQDYERSMPSRMQVAQARTDLAAAGLPIDAEQARALGRLLADEQRRAQEDFRALNIATPFSAVPTTRATPGAAATGLAVPAAPPSAEERLRQQRTMLEMAERTNARLRDAAAAVLTAEQLEIFMQPRVTGVATQRATLRVQEATAGADPGTADAGR